MLASTDAHDTILCAVGDPLILERARRLVGAAAEIVPVADPLERPSSPSSWPIVAVPATGPATDGVASAASGHAAGDAIVRAVELMTAERAGAIAAAPSNKHALHLAGYLFDDHTRMLGHLTGTPEPLLMPVSGSFRVVSVTDHASLADACARLTPERVVRTIRAAAHTLRQMGIAAPRIAVAALNPHNGEGGDLGRDEILTIAPAVAAARAEGLDAEGPLPADSLFTPERRGRYDVFVTMYHDQGRIAQKAVAFGRIVVITAGLPFFFATVGHGSAYDIAWRGRADPANMRETVRYAARAAARAFVLASV